MKKTALATMLSAAVICAGMSASAFAQDANAQAESTTEQSTQVVDTHMQAAIDVVEQTGTIPPFEGTLKQIVLNSKRWLIRENPSAEKDIIATVDEISKKYEDQRPQLVRSVAVAWTRYLKEDELKEVLAFFKTPAGQKFANYQPRILGESVRGIQEFSAILTNVIVKTAKQELNKKGYKFSE
ncbi:DUF2059 domain-containing protein [uncultured Cohaesibacter sp.]|uniref:DUF2059 domain-containing protein n=1 Tax=uncultured Cohaesibacter sp. TaxID=1002546 RepID=UPI002A0A24E2|nr:DUF2059 domain-containing protein [uncultured Cohaesibacter sp.]